MIPKRYFFESFWAVITGMEEGVRSKECVENGDKAKLLLWAVGFDGLYRRAVFQRLNGSRENPGNFVSPPVQK